MARSMESELSSKTAYQSLEVQQLNRDLGYLRVDLAAISGKLDDLSLSFEGQSKDFESKFDEIKREIVELDKTVAVVEVKADTTLNTANSTLDMASVHLTWIGVAVPALLAVMVSGFMVRYIAKKIGRRLGSDEAFKDEALKSLLQDDQFTANLIDKVKMVMRSDDPVSTQDRDVVDEIREQVRG